MAKYAYLNTENAPIVMEFTLHDLKVLDRVLTDYIDPDQWGYEKGLHKEIREALHRAHEQMGTEHEYTGDRFSRTVEYTVKLKTKADA
jgi:hypothetical protein